MAGHRDIVLGERQRAAGGHRELEPDEVDAGDELGHAVLDLQARVHLQERALVVADDELDRPDSLVGDGLGRGDCRFPHRPADRVGDERGRRLLNHLLVAPLDGAVAVVEVKDVPVPVGDDLHLDVAGPDDVPLEEDLVGAERRRRLPPGRGDRVGERGRAVDQPHAAATAAG